MKIYFCHHTNTKMRSNRQECNRADVNVCSHRIDKFSFGSPQGGIVQPLEGDEKIANKSEYYVFLQGDHIARKHTHTLC